MSVSEMKESLLVVRSAIICGCNMSRWSKTDTVVSATVQCNVHHDIGFLNDTQRLNVAMTRARAAVVILGTGIRWQTARLTWKVQGVWKRLLHEVDQGVGENGGKLDGVPVSLMKDGKWDKGNQGRNQKD